MALTPVVPRSIKKFTNPLSTAVSDKTWIALVKDSVWATTDFSYAENLSIASQEEFNDFSVYSNALF